MEHRYSTTTPRQHYVVEGDGDVVVLLHGWPETWYCWRRVMPLLSDCHRVIAPDLRGLGDTEDPHEGYDKRSIARDVRRLLDELGVERYHLVGHDWGGVVAWSLAANWPAGIRSLSIVDVAIPGDGAPDISQGGRRWHHAFHQTRELPETLVTGREAEYLGWFYDNYGAGPHAIDDEERAEYLRSYREPARLAAGFEYYRALPQDARDNAEKATENLPAMPVLAIGGGEGFGRGAEVEASLRRMARDVEGLVIPGAGHWVPEEQPEALARALRAFFDRVSGSGTTDRPPLER